MPKLDDQLKDKLGKNADNYCHQFQQEAVPYEQQNDSWM